MLRTAFLIKDILLFGKGRLFPYWRSGKACRVNLVRASVWVTMSSRPLEGTNMAK